MQSTILTDSSSLASSGVDSFNVKGKYVSIGKTEVHYLDTNKGIHAEVYTLGEDQKTDLRRYLSLIMGDPKLVCVDKDKTHHSKIVEVIKQLEERRGEGIRLYKRVTKGDFIAL